MKLWTRSRDTDAADVDVNKQMKEETTRRKWCIEQAALVEEMRPEVLLKTAVQIYEYVWGK